MITPPEFCYGCAYCTLSELGMKLNFKYPSLAVPGLPNFTLGAMKANLAGIDFALRYLPPNPKNLPKLPSIDLFVQPFLANIKLPEAHPSFSAFGIKIPAVGSPPYKFDMSGIFKLIVVSIKTIFEAFIFIIKSIINLSLKIPGVTIIIDLFKSFAIQIGLGGEAVFKYAGCLAKQIVKFLTSMLPV